MKDKNNEIVSLLTHKSATKQQIYRITLEVFTQFKKQLDEVHTMLASQMNDANVEIRYTDAGTFEAHLKFSGDTLIFMMHTNVFTFPDAHFTKTGKYVKEDPMRGYCGLIQIYNFLSDSIKYNREEDLGDLVARIFVNKDKHFFIEGKRPLSLNHNKFHKESISNDSIVNIIQECILYCLNFDLITPPIELVQNITVDQKNYQSYSSGFATSKNVGIGFQFRSMSKESDNPV
ncbi:MAG: hypothetical protein EXR21_00950 [Flavobacteriaceae bacterium]|nr:hypothetical protein [Flavobacteriaceae bacterium]